MDLNVIVWQRVLVASITKKYVYHSYPLIFLLLLCYNLYIFTIYLIFNLISHLSLSLCLFFYFYTLYNIALWSRLYITTQDNYESKFSEYKYYSNCSAINPSRLISDTFTQESTTFSLTQR